MRNLKGIAIVLMVLFIASTAFAVSAEEKDFIILGRTTEDPDGNSILAQEMVDLYPAPGTVDTIYGQLKSGTVFQVLQKVELETEVFWYNISTVGRGGGLMGWVTEEYIYEITEVPIEE